MSYTVFNGWGMALIELKGEISMKPVYNLYIESKGEKTTGRLYAVDKDMFSFSPSNKYALDLDSEAEANALVDQFKNVLNLRVAKFV